MLFKNILNRTVQLWVELSSSPNLVMRTVDSNTWRFKTNNHHLQRNCINFSFDWSYNGALCLKILLIVVLEVMSFFLLCGSLKGRNLQAVIVSFWCMIQFIFITCVLTCCNSAIKDWHLKTYILKFRLWQNHMNKLQLSEAFPTGLSTSNAQSCGLQKTCLFMAFLCQTPCRTDSLQDKPTYT